MQPSEKVAQRQLVGRQLPVAAAIRELPVAAAICEQQLQVAICEERLPVAAIREYLRVAAIHEQQLRIAPAERLRERLSGCRPVA